MDDIVKLFKESEKISDVVKVTGFSEHKVRRILLNAGLVKPSMKLRKAREMYVRGLSINEISDTLRLSKKYIQQSLPYIKGSYNSDFPSENALKIRRTRAKAETIGEKIRFYREERGMTQLQLSELLGKQQPELARWESGKKVPRIDTLKQISVALECTIEDLI